MTAASMPRNRAAALAIAAAFLGFLRGMAPAPEERATWLYLIVVPLGYGHVIGASVFARSRRAPARAPGRERVSAAVFESSSLATIFSLYTWALGSPQLQPFVLAPILLLFAWHVAENDLALGRAYRDRMRLPPVSTGPRSGACALLLVVAGGVVAFSTREGAGFAHAYFGRTLLPAQAWLTLDELAAALVLYHTVSWLLFFEDRARALRLHSAAQAARLRRRVLAFHAAPVVLVAVLARWLPETEAFLAAPAHYFFWSAMHSIHTAVARGLAPRAATA
jgi:hypothetical protein